MLCINRICFRVGIYNVRLSRISGTAFVGFVSIDLILAEYRVVISAFSKLLTPDSTVIGNLVHNIFIFLVKKISDLTAGELFFCSLSIRIIKGCSLCRTASQIVAVYDFSVTILSAHTADRRECVAFTATHNSCIIAVYDGSIIHTTADTANVIVDSVDCSRIVAVYNDCWISDATADAANRTAGSADYSRVDTGLDRTTVVSADTANITVSLDGSCIPAIFNRGKIGTLSAHTSHIGSRIEIRIHKVHIGNSGTLVISVIIIRSYRAKQTNRRLIRIVEIKAADRMILTVKGTGILVIIVRSYRCPASQAVCVLGKRTVWIQHIRIDGDILRQYRIR